MTFEELAINQKFKFDAGNLSTVYRKVSPHQYIYDFGADNRDWVSDGDWVWEALSYWKVTPLPIQPLLAT